MANATNFTGKGFIENTTLQQYFDSNDPFDCGLIFFTFNSNSLTAGEIFRFQNSSIGGTRYVAAEFDTSTLLGATTVYLDIFIYDDTKIGGPLSVSYDVTSFMDGKWHSGFIAYDVTLAVIPIQNASINVLIDGKLQSQLAGGVQNATESFAIYFADFGIWTVGGANTVPPLGQTVTSLIGNLGSLLCYFSNNQISVDNVGTRKYEFTVFVPHMINRTFRNPSLREKYLGKEAEPVNLIPPGLHTVETNIPELTNEDKDLPTHMQVCLYGSSSNFVHNYGQFNTIASTFGVALYPAAFAIVNNVSGTVIQDATSDPQT